ncbi:MAG: hypothetical protein U9N36_12435 [Euryarchaeota archaeon]|nr:hypothetical protein [Euryarchaeota archaeon]
MRTIVVNFVSIGVRTKYPVPDLVMMLAQGQVLLRMRTFEY